MIFYVLAQVENGYSRRALECPCGGGSDLEYRRSLRLCDCIAAELGIPRVLTLARGQVCLIASLRPGRRWGYGMRHLSGRT